MKKVATSQVEQVPLSSQHSPGFAYWFSFSLTLSLSLFFIFLLVLSVKLPASVSGLQSGGKRNAIVRVVFWATVDIIWNCSLMSLKQRNPNLWFPCFVPATVTVLRSNRVSTLSQRILYIRTPALHRLVTCPIARANVCKRYCTISIGSGCDLPAWERTHAFFLLEGSKCNEFKCRNSRHGNTNSIVFMTQWDYTVIL